MLSILGPLLIVAALPSAPIERRYEAAVDVFRARFDEADDTNYDRWPDGWSRRRGLKYPPYVSVGITDRVTATELPTLRVDLDGGGAAVLSPAIPVSSQFSYLLEAEVKTDRLVHDQARLSISLFNAERELLQTFDSQSLSGTADWTKLRLGPVMSSSALVAYAVIGLHVEPTKGMDLVGSASFRDVWLGRVPKLTLTADVASHLYNDPERPALTCEVSGMSDAAPSIALELFDVDGTLLERSEQLLSGRLTPVNIAHSPPEKSNEAIAPRDRVFVGSAQWRPRLPGKGFYRVRVGLPGEKGIAPRQELTFAIIDEQPAPPDGEFGWTLPRGEGTLPLPALVDLLSRTGVSWVKFPLWIAADDDARAEQAVWLAERLQGANIRLVGLLSTPPADVARKVEGFGPLSAAQVFSADPATWYPSLEPMLTRLSLSVQHWQLGADDDTSYVDYAQLAKHLALVRSKLEQFGQQVSLGFGWDLLSPSPLAKSPPWGFVSYSADPQLTAEEQRDYLEALRGEPAQRWISLRPLDRSRYSLTVRASDLAHRMATAKLGGASAVFLADPFDPRSGVLRADGAVDELLLPWRTTALQLAGAEYLGELPLPGGSPNHVFVRGDRAVVMLWNDVPQTESLYLGDDVERLDLWGRTQRLPMVDGLHVIEAGPTPVFIAGIAEPLIRWHMACQFKLQRVPSVFGVTHANELTVKNFFPHGVSGHVRVQAPDGWRVTPSEFTLKLSAGEVATLPFEMALPLTASSGRQDVRIEFDLLADRRHKFSLTRPIEVGLGDVLLDAQTQLNNDGQLEVTQLLRNQTPDLVNFRCQLYAPGRRRLLMQVTGAGTGVDRRVFKLDDGADLVGQTLWLRAEEIDGPRTLNHRFVVER